MSPRILALGFAAATIVGAAGWTVHSARVATAAGATLGALEKKRGDLQRANHAAQQRVAALRARQEELDAVRSESRPGVKPAAAPAANGAEAVDPKMAAAMEAYARTPWRDIVLERNPELQARYLAAQRSEWTAKYLSLWRRLGLPDAQVERFMAIMTDAAARDLDLNAARRTQGLAETDPAMVRLREESARRTEAAELELLGETGFAQFQEYERVLPVRMMVDGLATSLVFLDAPLSAAQADQLTQVILEANEGYRRNGRPDPVFPNDILARRPARETVDSARVLERAREFLSPAQYTRLESEFGRMKMVYQMVNLITESSSEPVIGFVFGRR